MKKQISKEIFYSKYKIIIKIKQIDLAVKIKAGNILVSQWNEISYSKMIEIQIMH